MKGGNRNFPAEKKFTGYPGSRESGNPGLQSLVGMQFISPNISSFSWRQKKWSVVNETKKAVRNILHEAVNSFRLQPFYGQAKAFYISPTQNCDKRPDGP